MICPNINSPEWKKLTSQVSENTAYDLWNTYEGNVPQSAIDQALGKIPTSITVPVKKVIKPGVSELFESNPELANSVYEALGFKTIITPNKIVSINNTNFGDETPSTENELSFNLKDIKIEEFNDIIKGTKATVYFSVPVDKTITFGKRANNIIAQMMLHKDGNIVTISSVAIYSPNVRVGENELKINEGKGIGKYIYELLGDKLLNEHGLILKSDASMSIGAQNVWSYLVKNNKAEKAQDGRYYYIGSKITPQQKQQAQQLYSQYLDTIFPDSEVKDIVYHGTNAEFEDFLEDTLNYFTISKGVAKKAGKYGTAVKYIKSVLLDIRRPFYEDYGNLSLKDYAELENQLYQSNSDGYISLDKRAFVPQTAEQIHILGGKQDIEGFKEYVRLNPPSKEQESVKVSLEEANAKLDSIMKTLLARIGVKYEAVDEILGPMTPEGGPIAKADLVNKVLQIVEGRADKTTITEEVVHFLIAMMDTNSHIYKSMYDLVPKYSIYQDVVKEYGNIAGYTEDKLRREAMAKLIAQEIANPKDVSTLNPVQSRNLNSWWNMLIAKARQLFNSFDKAMFTNAVNEFNPFREIALKIVNQDLDIFNQTITDTHTYYQLNNAPNEKQKETLEKVKSLSQGISREGTGEDRGYYKNGKKLGKSVTQRRDEKFDVKFKNAKRTPEFEALVKESGRIGTLVHDDMDNISKRILTRDDSVTKVVKTNATIYAKLEAFAKGLLKLHGEDAVYLSEQIVYDPSTDTPGTVDLIVIDKEGVVHIYDWKTMTLKKQEKEEFGEPSYYKTVKYEYQLNSYKDIIEKGGVKSFGKRRYFPIETVFKKDKTTGEVYFADIDLNIPGGRAAAAAKPYLNPVPVSNEKIGDPALDKLLGQLLALQKEIRTKKALNPAEQAKKNQRIISLNRAIRDLQLNKNLGLFVESAAIQFKSIEARLADKTIPLSEAELVDMKEELEVYTNLSTKFARLYEQNKIPQEHIIKFDGISGKASRLAVQIDNKLEDYFKKAALEAGLSEESLRLYKEKGAKPIGLTGKLTTALSRIDHPIFRTFWNLVNKAKVQTKKDTDALQGLIVEKLTALREWGSRNNLKGTAIFDIMLDRKSGKLISKHSEEFYKLRAKKIADGDWQWMKDNTVLDEAGLKKYIKQQQDYIKQTVFSSNSEYNKKVREVKLKELHDNFDVFNNPKAYASSSDFMRPFLKPNDKWLSEAYKKLKANKPAFEFYELFTSKMKEFGEFMPFNKEGKRINFERFIPNLKADLIERTLNNGGSESIRGLGQEFADLFDVRYDEELRLGQINEFTGEYERQVPVYYTRELDPKEKSYDLGKVLLLFGNKAYNYKYMSQIEGTARNLRNALADSSEALVDGNGKIIKNLLKSDKIVSANTLETFNAFIDYYVYGVKEIEDYGYFTKKKVVVNPKTGEEEIVEQKYSTNKLAKTALQLFATKALGLNLISGGAQIFGNNINSLILAFGGQHFNLTQWAKAKTLATSGVLNPEVYQFLQVLDIRGDNDVFKKANTLSINETARQANLEKAFFIYEYADNALFKTISVAMIQSHGVAEDGKVKHLSKLPEGTKSIYEQLALTPEGTSNITSLISEEEYRKFRNKIQSLGEKITGMSTRDNMSGWRLSVAGQALMQFRGWIPRTITARFGAAKYDNELEVVERGRFLSLLSQIVNRRVIPLTGELLRGAVTGQFGVNTENLVDTLYNQFMEENPHLSREEVTKEMFYEMHVANTKAALMEISLYLAFMMLIGGLKEGWDDDDEDKRFRSETLKTLNRFSDEIGFYLNPNSFQAITRGAVPAVSVITDMFRFFGDLFGWAKGVAIDNEVDIHNNKPAWAFMRAFVPGGTTMWNWFGDKTIKKEEE